MPIFFYIRVRCVIKKYDWKSMVTNVFLSFFSVLYTLEGQSEEIESLVNDFLLAWRCVRDQLLTFRKFCFHQTLITIFILRMCILIYNKQTYAFCC